MRAPRFSKESCMARHTRHHRASMAAAVTLATLLAGCAVQPVPDAVGSDRYIIPVAVRAAATPPPTGPAAPLLAAASRRQDLSERPGGCFSGQIGQEPWSARAADATVQVLISDARGWRANSTGFVVRGSGEPGDPENRIVTAWHSVDRATRGGHGLIAIRNAAGVSIGRAEVVARGRSGATTTRGRSVPRGDMAVLAMRDFVAGGQAAYTAIEGVDLAIEQPGSVMTGIFERPGGIEPGASGSAVLDQQGRAIGVVIARDRVVESEDDHLWAVKVTVEGGSPVRWLGPGVAASPVRNVTLLARSEGFALPLGDSDILGALGAAASGVTSRSSWTDRAVIEDVTIPGYPLGTCIVFRGSVTPGGVTQSASR